MGSFDQLFDHAPFPALAVEGPERRIVYANEAYHRVVGPRALIGRPYAEALGDIAAQGYLAKIDQVFRSGRPCRGEGEPTHIERPNGAVETFWFDFVYQPLFAADGTVEGVLGLSYDCTGRVHFEQELEAGERRMAIATRAAGIGVWDWDQATNLMTYSARAREICGYPPDGPVSFEMAVRSTHPDDLPRTRALSDRARDPSLRERPVYEYRLVRPSGEIRWVRAYGEAVFDGSGPRARCLHYIGTLEDVTGARERDLRLRESEARLQLALDAGRMAVFDWTWEQEDFELTPEQRVLFGVAPGERSTVADRRARYHPDDRTKVAATLSEARDSGQRYCDFGFRYLHPDGRLRWLEVRSEIVRDDIGAPQTITGVIMDVTDARELAERLRLSEARLQLALDAGRMAVFDWPYSQDDLPLTPALRQVLEIGADEISTVETRRSRYHPDDRERVIAARHKALEAGKRYCDFEFRYTGAGGDTRWLQVRSEIVSSLAEGPSLIGVISDVTERKDAEERLELMARELDHRANNLLAVIQGTVSLSRAADAEALRGVIEGRISALARAHRLLSDARWKGADLRTVIEQELQPYGLERARLSGPDCALPAAHAQALAMALHELATNAVKYGALSVDGGLIAVSWRADDVALELTWRETGGPRVTAPARMGLGTTVVTRALGGGLGGGALLDWPTQGLTARLTLPLRGTGSDPASSP